MNKPLSRKEVLEIYARDNHEMPFGIGNGMSIDLMDWLEDRFEMFPKRLIQVAHDRKNRELSGRMAKVEEKRKSRIGEAK